MSWVRKAVIGCILGSFGSLLNAAQSAERVYLTPGNESDQLTHVSIQLEAGGHNVVRPAKDDKPATEDQSLPISVSAKLGYDEKRMASSGEATAGTVLAVR